MQIKDYISQKLDEKYYSFEHKSGLKVYVFPKEMSTSYAIFATKYGSLENKFKLATDDEFTTVPAGIAHFLEHKMFENEDGVDTFEKFAKTGASANAYTSFDKTAYLFSATDNFYESLEILLEFVTHPYFTKETVDKEQGIISQEIRMYEDNPSNRLYYELLRAMYEVHDVRIEIGGTVESIANITPELLYKCYNTFYNLNNMALCVCGDVDVEKVNAVLDKMLEPAKKLDVVREYATEKPEAYQKCLELNMQVSMPQFAIGVKDIDIPTDKIELAKKDFAMKILNDILFSSSTEFYNEMYERGILNSRFGCEYDNSTTFAYNIYVGETEKPKEFFEIFKKYIKRCQNKEISEDAFLRAKRSIYADFIRLFDSTDEISNELICYAFLNIDLFDNLDVIDTIDKEYVEKLLIDCFKEEYFALSIVSPLE